MVGRDEKTDLASAQDRHEGETAVRHLGRQRSGQGRRLGRRGRQSVRARRHGDRRHRLGGRAQHQRGAVRRLHPDRRADQPRQFRRPDLQPRRRSDRHQHRDLLALGRLGRDRLCGAGEHREKCDPAAQRKGQVTRGWLGVAIQDITPTIAKSLGLDPEQPTGALVASVTPNSPAAKAGIRQGDVVTAGGRPIRQRCSDLPRLVATTARPEARPDDPSRRQGDQTRRVGWRIVGEPEASGRRDTRRGPDILSRAAARRRDP